MTEIDYIEKYCKACQNGTVEKIIGGYLVRCAVSSPTVCKKKKFKPAGRKDESSAKKFVR